MKALRLKTHYFHTKIAISGINVKTNRMVSPNWTYHKERSFASNNFIFLEIPFQFKNLLKRDYLMYQQPKCPYSYFLLALGFSLTMLFPLSILNIITFVIQLFCAASYLKQSNKIPASI